MISISRKKRPPTPDISIAEPCHKWPDRKQGSEVMAATQETECVAEAPNETTPGPGQIAKDRDEEVQLMGTSEKTNGSEVMAATQETECVAEAPNETTPGPGQIAKDRDEEVQLMGTSEKTNGDSSDTTGFLQVDNDTMEHIRLLRERPGYKYYFNVYMNGDRNRIQEAVNNWPDLEQSCDYDDFQVRFAVQIMSKIPVDNATNESFAESDQSLKADNGSISLLVMDDSVSNQAEQGDESSPVLSDAAAFPSTSNNQDIPSRDNIYSPPLSLSSNTTNEQLFDDMLSVPCVVEDEFNDDIDLAPRHNPFGKKRCRVVQAEKLFTAKCCNEQHIMELFSEEELLEIRLCFNAEFEGLRKEKQFLLDYFRDNVQADGTFEYRIRRRNVCQAGFRIIYGITKTRFRDIRIEFSSGVKTAIHGLTGTEKPMSRSYMCMAFFEEFFSINCDIQPNKSERHLPDTMNRANLYDEYKIGTPDPLSLTSFMRILNSFYPDVKFPKTSRFTKCDECCSISLERKAAGSHDYEVIAKLAVRKRNHLLLQGKQRIEFLRRSLNAIRYPETFGCIVTDGAAQDNFLLPRCNLKPAGMAKGDKLQVHVFGSYMFGRKLLCILDYGQFSHDTNFNITSILTLLYDERFSLPKCLHIQLDNTCSQNKNSILNDFCAYLVQSGLLDEVTIGFLMKGHTHCIIDQVFSRIAEKLSNDPRGVVTLSQLVAIIERSWKRREGDRDIIPEVRFLEEKYDFNRWLKPHSIGSHRLRPYHQFRFSRNSEGICQMQFKEWADSDWHSKTLQLLTSLPEGRPKVVRPDNARVEITKIKATIKASKRLKVINDAENDEWIAFLDKLEADKEDINTDEGYCQMLDDIIDAKQSRSSGTVADASTSESCQTELIPVLTAKEDARYRAECTATANVSGVAAEEVEIGKFCVLIPDIDWCVENYEKDNDYSPLNNPWIGKIITKPNSDGKFKLRYYDGSLKGSYWASQQVKEAVETSCKSVLFCFPKLTTGKKLGRAANKIEKAYEPYMADFTSRIS